MKFSGMGHLPGIYAWVRNEIGPDEGRRSDSSGWDLESDLEITGAATNAFLYVVKLSRSDHVKW